MRGGKPERVGGTQVLRSRQVWYLLSVLQTSTCANEACRASPNMAPACPSSLSSHTSVSQPYWPFSDAPAHPAFPSGSPASSYSLGSPSCLWPCQHLLACVYIWPLQNGTRQAPSSCESPVTPSPGIMSLPLVFPGNVRLRPICACAGSVPFSIGS